MYGAHAEAHLASLNTESDDDDATAWPELALEECELLLPALLSALAAFLPGPVLRQNDTLGTLNTHASSDCRKDTDSREEKRDGMDGSGWNGGDDAARGGGSFRITREAPWDQDTTLRLFSLAEQVRFALWRKPFAPSGESNCMIFDLI